MTETSPAAQAEEPVQAPREPRTGLLVTLVLAWLAVILWSIAANGPAVTSVAIALPTGMAASLLAGGAAGLGAVTTLARRQPVTAARALPRLVGAVPAGLVVGALAGASVLLTWRVQESLTGLAVAIGLAAVLGAVLAVLVPHAVAAAGLAATLGVFLTGFLINLVFRERLMSLFGADGTAAARVDAFRWFAPTAAALSAIVGGLLAYRRLRGRAPDARWPAYLAAGVTPGVMLLLAEVFTRVGGARLLAVAASSEADSIAFAWAADSRINHGLVVLFLCPIVAMIAFGRTLPSRADDDLLEGDATAEGEPLEGDATVEGDPREGDPREEVRAAEAASPAGRPDPSVPKPAAPGPEVAKPTEPQRAAPGSAQPS
ncbi:MAG: hypothetical protein FWJ93_09185 [Micromonosporaceae bacterium]